MSDMQIGLNRQLNNIAAVILERGTLEYKVISKHIGKNSPPDGLHDFLHR